LRKARKLRTRSSHPAAMLEALRKLYGTAPLAEEIEGRR
jgi:hypothetical protein